MEIMVSMLIISVVSSVTLPAIDNFHSADRVKTDAQLLVSAIRHAKYTALQDNVLIRIVFNSDGSCFKEQIYTGSKTDKNSVIKTDSIHTDTSKYELDSEWSSISDTEETEFNPSTEIDFNEFFKEISTKVIYFKPDGYIYYNKPPSVLKIPEERLIFKYGNAAIAVDINSLGIISSESFARNEDDEYEDGEDIEW